jgi:hypothetical protein
MIFRLAVAIPFFWGLNRLHLRLGLLPMPLSLTIFIRYFFAHNTLVSRPNW